MTLLVLHSCCNSKVLYQSNLEKVPYEYCKGHLTIIYPLIKEKLKEPYISLPSFSKDQNDD